ncbi:MAG TPA: signal peptidase II, partial [Bacteroidales bacterium]|nr:signal peptidase II [Bacteroidales bacterium]
MKSNTIKSIVIIFIVLLIDQALKIWIKTNMILGQEYNILGNWFIIHFTENNGMAFGMEFWGEHGKMFLTLFRIVAVIGIGWYLRWLIKEKAPNMVI